MSLKWTGTPVDPKNKKQMKELLSWFAIRDLFVKGLEIGLPLPGEPNNLISKSLLQAADCSHPDAIWLRETFNKDMNFESIVGRLKILSVADYRARTFDLVFVSGYLREQAYGTEKLFKQVALETDYPFAHAMYAIVLCERVSFDGSIAIMETALRHAEFAIKNGQEPLAHGVMTQLAVCNVNYNAKVFVYHCKMAAKLGSLPHFKDLMRIYVLAGSPKATYWRCKSKIHLKDYGALEEMKSNTKDFLFRYYYSKAIVDSALFIASEMVKFNVMHVMDAMDFYRATHAACKHAIKTWSLVGLRLGVVKDMRIMIGHLIWKERARWCIVVKDKHTK